MTLTMSEVKVAQSCPTLGLQFARLLSPWNSPDNNIRVGWHFLLQDIDYGCPYNGIKQDLDGIICYLMHLSYGYQCLKKLVKVHKL